MRDVVWAAVVDLSRACPIRPGDEESRQHMLRAYETYVRNVKSRLPGQTEEGLEREGRGFSLFQAKWSRAMWLWETKVRNAAAQARPEPAWKPSDGANDNARAKKPNGSGSANDQSAEFSSTSAGDKAKEKSRGEQYTAADLKHMDLPPTKYVVPGYIVEGATLVAGKPKLGKSWLALQIAIAIARGGYTLGKVQCVEGDVLYCALEDNKKRMKRRMRKLIPVGQWPERLMFLHDMPRLLQGGVAVVRDWLEAHPPRLVIIDTLGKVREPSKIGQSSYESDYDQILELKKLAEDKGVAIVLVHHQRKMPADDPLDTVSGTTGLTGAVDTILVLSRDPHGVTLYGTGRDLEGIERAIEFDKASCVWTVTGEAQDVHRSKERGRIITALNDASAPKSARDIADLVGSSLPAVKMMLGRMMADGEVRRAGRGLFERN